PFFPFFPTGLPQGDFGMRRVYSLEFEDGVGALLAYGRKCFRRQRAYGEPLPRHERHDRSASGLTAGIQDKPVSAALQVYTDIGPQPCLQTFRCGECVPHIVESRRYRYRKSEFLIWLRDLRHFDATNL